MALEREREREQIAGRILLIKNSITLQSSLKNTAPSVSSSNQDTF